MRIADKAKDTRDMLRQLDPSCRCLSGRRSDTAGVVEWWCEAKERSLKIEPDLVQVGKFPDLDVVPKYCFRSFSS